MTIKRGGKCANCNQPTTEQKTFIVPVDMFNPDPEVKIEGGLSIEIKAWRKTKLYCERHRP